MNTKSKVLLITSSGGAGHLQAAKVIEEELQNAEIVKIDILSDWIGRLGVRFAKMWDASLKQDSVKAQMWLAKKQPIADFLFWIPIFIHAYKTLRNTSFDRVIDTQAVGTSAIVKAIKWSKRPLKLEKILTELPSPKLPHFFSALHTMSKSDRSLLRIHSMPLLSNEAKVWKKTYRLSTDQITTRPPLLRSSFVKLLSEKPTIDQIVVDGPEGKKTYPIHKNDRVTTIMLGSKPAKKATFEYISSFIKAKKHFPDKRDFLFVFTNSPYAFQVPKGLTLVQMGFQKDTTLAPLLYRSDATLTRSGGLTSMELLAIAKGKVWIHSKARKKEALIQGMPIWESGNASYLSKAKGAICVTPKTFAENCKELFAST